MDLIKELQQAEEVCAKHAQTLLRFADMLDKQSVLLAEELQETKLTEAQNRLQLNQIVERSEATRLAFDQSIACLRLLTLLLSQPTSTIAVQLSVAPPMCDVLKRLVEIIATKLSLSFTHLKNRTQVDVVSAVWNVLCSTSHETLIGVYRTYEREVHCPAWIALTEAKINRERAMEGLGQRALTSAL
jgi:hypothetical protein